MTELKRQVKKTAKTAPNISGTIVDVFGATASVRLGNNGSLLRNIKVIGGPVKVGQTVDVSFQQSPPVIIAYAPAGITEKQTSAMVDTARTPFITAGAAATGGGHVIMDSAYTAKAQRANLRFVGSPTSIIGIGDESGADATNVTVYGIKIYHNGVFVAYAASLNFVDS